MNTGLIKGIAVAVATVACTSIVTIATANVNNDSQPEESTIKYSLEENEKCDMLTAAPEYTVLTISKRNIDIPESWKEIKAEAQMRKASNAANAVIEEIVEQAEESKCKYALTDYERWYVGAIVAGEAGAESMDGKMAVAQCILNAMLLEGYTPEQVRRNYQYAGWNESLAMESSVQEAITRVFDNGETVTDKYILYFYAPALCYSSWHESQDYAGTFGTQKFFARW